MIYITQHGRPLFTVKLESPEQCTLDCHYTVDEFLTKITDAERQKIIQSILSNIVQSRRLRSLVLHDKFFFDAFFKIMSAKDKITLFSSSISVEENYKPPQLFQNSRQLTLYIELCELLSHEELMELLSILPHDHRLFFNRFKEHYKTAIPLLKKLPTNKKLKFLAYLFLNPVGKLTISKDFFSLIFEGSSNQELTKLFEGTLFELAVAYHSPILFNGLIQLLKTLPSYIQVDILTERRFESSFGGSIIYSFNVLEWTIFNSFLSSQLLGIVLDLPVTSQKSGLLKNLKKNIRNFNYQDTPPKIPPEIDIMLGLTEFMEKADALKKEYGEKSDYYKCAHKIYSQLQTDFKDYLNSDKSVDAANRLTKNWKKCIQSESAILKEHRGHKDNITKFLICMTGIGAIILAYLSCTSKPEREKSNRCGFFPGVIVTKTNSIKQLDNLLSLTSNLCSVP